MILRLQIIAVDAGLLAAAHRSAGSDWGNDGDLQLCSDRNRTWNDGNVWHHLPRSGRIQTAVSTISESLCPWTGPARVFQGRALSRAKSRRNLDFQDVLDKLADMGIAIRVASPKLVMEEVRKTPSLSKPRPTRTTNPLELRVWFSFQAPESYKNVTDVVNTCHDAGISKKAIKLRPIAVIKGWRPELNLRQGSDLVILFCN